MKFRGLINKGSGFYLFLFFCFFCQFLFLRLVVWDGRFPVFNAVKTCVADASLFFLICLPFRGRWKIATLVIPLLTALLVYLNVLYFRYFSDLIPSALYSSLSVLNTETLRGGGSMLRWYDVFFWIMSFSPLVYARLISFRVFFETNASCAFFAADLVLLLVSWIFVYQTAYVSVAEEDIDWADVPGEILRNPYLDWKYSYKQLCFTGYITRCIIYSNSGYLNLTLKQSELVGKFLEKKAKAPTDSTLLPCRPPKNLVFIVVESLPAVVFESERLSKYSPFISSLVSDDSNLYASLRVLTKYGNSSDAQFIYNTGLLPLRTEALVSNYANQDFPSLAKAIGGESIEVIGEDKVMWNHYQTTQAYGFDRLVDGVAPYGFDQDSLIFKKGAAILERLTTPFYIFVTTMTLHSPYNSRRVSWAYPPDLEDFDNPFDREYLNRLRFFDSQLERFIGVLKSRPDYEETMVIIAGDHDIMGSEVSQQLQDDHVPLLILNCPMARRPEGDYTQADVFPTIMQLLGLNYLYEGVPYRGVGNSLYSKNAAPLSAQDYEVSEMIIRKNPNQKIR